MTPEITAAASETFTTYLMWVGKEHYPTIADYVAEAKEHGISKRVATPEIAAKLSSPNTLVFLAHDEGEHEDCEHCLGSIENPEWRKLTLQVKKAAEVLTDRIKLTKRIAERIRRGKKSGKLEGEKLQAAEDEKAKADRLVKGARAKFKKLTAELEGEPETLTAGTGGHVILKDGSRWDYRRYMYWRNQPKKWDFKKETKEAHMCPHCGGFGKLPKGKVFGVFMPAAAEYIMKPEDGEEARKAMEAKGLTAVPAGKVADEVKRGCGRRKHGGSYVVTRTDGSTPDALKAKVSELVADGIVKSADVEVNGQFAEFIETVDIFGEKRFRGIKLWEPTPAAAAEAEDIVDAA